MGQKRKDSDGGGSGGESAGGGGFDHAAAVRAAGVSALDRGILGCRRCDRLIAHCRATAEAKRAAYRDEVYHGGPAPNFLPAGGAKAVRLLIVGLAPGAHGANRTGRMFTGDRSGDFLYAAMHAVGLASQAASVHVGDGLRLRGCGITAAAHCAPPGNKPTRDELEACRPWLESLLGEAKSLRAMLCLGGLALGAVLSVYKSRGWVKSISAHRFGHGVVHFEVKGDGGGGGRGGRRGGDAPWPIVCSYHPSQQNTFTGRLTPSMLEAALAKGASLAGLGRG